MSVNKLKNKLEFQTSQIWRKIFEDHIPGEELYKLILNTSKISTVTLLINHTCNLRCKHCFYGNDILFEPELSIKEWKSVINQLFDIGVRHFHIAGREPFASNKIIGILEYLKKIKSAQEIRYGVITNGIFVKQYLDQLFGLNIDYIDFSIDGTKKVNNWLRGEGSFEKTVKNLKLALNRKITKIYVDSIAHEKNYRNLPVMIRKLSRIGVDYFFIQPMLPIGRAKKLKNTLISPSQYNNLIDSCHSLLMSSNKLIVKLLIYPSMFPFLYEQNEKVKQIAHNYMKTGSSILKARNSILSFEFHPFCMSHWRECQITADGYYIGCFMTLIAEDYRKYSMGNVRKENIRKLWVNSLQRNSLLHKIIKSYNNTVKCKSCNYFWFCHGGCRMASYIKYGVWDREDITCYRSKK